MELKEIEAKNILTVCRIPGIDVVINPYIGCAFACKYCYASFMGRFVGRKVEDWGSYVFAKTNAAQLLARDLAKKMKDKGRGKEIFLSSVTDPYQGLEAKYKLTRGCLEELISFGYEGLVSILTKSDLVLRDIDLLKQLKNISVGLTVTSADDGISRYFEKFAPPVSARYKALETLNKNKIATYAFVGPLLPHFVANPDQLENIFSRLAQAGTKRIFMEHLNLSSYIRSRLAKEMKGVEAKVVEKFYSSQSKKYRDELEEIIKSLIKKYQMTLLSDQVIFHEEYQKQGK